MHRWLLLPWSGLRWLLASLLWRFQRFAVRYHFWWFFWSYAGGRHIDWTPVWCDRCWWAGPLRWAVHDYQDTGDGDVALVDECPRCGAEVP